MHTQAKPSIPKSIFFSVLALILFYLLCVIIGIILVLISSILLMIPIIGNLLNYFVEDRGDGFAVVIPVLYLTAAYFLTALLHDRVIKFIPTRRLTMKLLGVYLVGLSSIAFLLNILGDGPWGISIGMIIAGIAFIIKSQEYTLPIIAPKESAEDKLCDSLSCLLSLSVNQRTALHAYITTFSNSIRISNKMSLNDIDSFIDHIIQSGYYIPSFDQYRHLGMVIILTSQIHVPSSICSSFSDWEFECTRSKECGLLLTQDPAAPSIDLWNVELSHFLEGLFNTNDQDYVFILERIIELAEEAHDDNATLPEYIARMAELPHKSERDTIYDTCNQIENHLRLFAEELHIDAEQQPTDQLEIFKRKRRNAKRVSIIRDKRTQILLTDESQPILHSL